MHTLMLILAAAAIVSAIASMMGKCPLTVPVFILAVIEVLRAFS